MMRRATILVLMAGALLSTACGARTINQVLADPAKYRNKEVKLSGSVVDSFGALGNGVYRLDDSTGQLWIVSMTGVPRQGARVDVKGTVREGFNLGSLGGRIGLPPGIAAGVVMIESSHEAR